MAKPGNPNWRKDADGKGISGSPGGKPGQYRKLLDKALAADTKKHKESILEFAVKKARTDSTVLNAILKKILPDLKSIEAKIEGQSPFRLILEYAPGTSDGPSKPKTAGKQDKKTSKLHKCSNPDGHSWRFNESENRYECEWCSLLGPQPIITAEEAAKK